MRLKNNKFIHNNYMCYLIEPGLVNIVIREKSPFYLYSASHHLEYNWVLLDELDGLITVTFDIENISVICINPIRSGKYCIHLGLLDMSRQILKTHKITLLII
jgi:hypothetical protein